MSAAAAPARTIAFVPSPAAETAADAEWGATIADWLAGLFLAPPSAETIESYRRGLGADLLFSLAQEPACQPGVAAMRQALTTGETATILVRHLNTTFTHLFDGVGGPRTVPPYESANVGASGRMAQAPAGEMDRLLRRFELQPGPVHCGPSDHLSIELALLAFLIRRDAEDGVEAEFLDRHLLVWLPTLASRCVEADRTGFYSGAARIAAAFLSARRARLQSVSTTGDLLCRIA